MKHMSTVVSGKRKKTVIRELVEGHQSASRLRFLLHNRFGFGVKACLSSSAHKLVANMLRSFTHSLSVLTSPDDVVSGENGSPAAEPPCLRRKSRDSTESTKRSLPAAPVTKNRRGCYKRRKTAQTWTVVSNTMDDDHAWRKYGQKEILNFRFPRSYLRCSRKYVEGCKAVKQVQQIQKNPEMYQITYIGYHTCKDSLKVAQVVADSGNYWESSSLADPAHSKLPDEVEQVRPSSFSTTVKQENPKEATQTPSGVTDNLDLSLWSDLKDFEPSVAAIMPSITEYSDHAGTVYSCSAEAVGSVHFDSDFHFYESQF